MRHTFTAAISAMVLAASVGACGRDSGESADGMNMGSEPSAVEEAHGFGAVKSVDQEARKVTISHGPIPEIGWGAMTMAFAVDERIDVSSLNAGDNIHFMLKPAGEGSYRVAMACRVEGNMEAHKAAMKSMMEGMQDGDMMMDMDMQSGMVMPCMKGAQDEAQH